MLNKPLSKSDVENMMENCKTPNERAIMGNEFAEMYGWYVISPASPTGMKWIDPRQQELFPLNLKIR